MRYRVRARFREEKKKEFHQILTGGHEIADADATQADCAIERCQDLRLLEPGTCK